MGGAQRCISAIGSGHARLIRNMATKTNKELLSELGIDISPEKLDLACPDGYLKQLSDELKTSPEELAAILKVKAGKAIGGGSDRYSVLSQWKGSYRF